MATNALIPRHASCNILALGLVAPLLACASCASAGRTATTVQRSHYEIAAERLLLTLDSLRQRDGIPGLAVAILHDTSVLAARGFGYADVEHQRVVSPETPFNIASVTKPISAVVALRLVASGTLDIDRPMRSFAGFADFCAAARADGGIFFSDYRCDTDSLTLRNVLGMTANGTPGTRFWYNPPSYSWASRPMAEVSGKPFSSLVDSLVFRPANMRRSARIHRRLPLSDALAADLALPYHRDSLGALRRSDPPPPQGDGAAGGVISTAMDLARFDQALTRGVLLPPTERAALWTPTRAPDGTSLPYGIGWFLGQVDGRRVAWHSGLWEGQYSALYLKVLSDVPDDRFTLILLANSDGLRWSSRLDEAAIDRSRYAELFLTLFAPSGVSR